MAEHPNALWVLAFVSFVESSVFPIPPDIMLIPMIVARPQAAWRIAAICTLASVLGAVLGYLIGWGLFEQVGRPVLGFYGMDAKFAEFAEKYNEWGAWAVLIAGITPFPFKVITILSGSTGLNFSVFVVASILARGFRFFVIAALLWKFGPPIKTFIEKRLGLVFIAFVIALLGGFLAIGVLR